MAAAAVAAASTESKWDPVPFQTTSLERLLKMHVAASGAGRLVDGAIGLVVDYAMPPHLYVLGSWECHLDSASVRSAQFATSPGDDRRVFAITSYWNNQVVASRHSYNATTRS